MTLFRPPDPPRWPAPRPLNVVQAAIVANVAAQDQALRQGRPDLLAELQERQKALYLERDRARFVERGIAPEVIRG